MVNRKRKTKPKTNKAAEDRSHCTTIVSHKLIKLEENRRKVIFKNDDQSKHSVTKVDNCLITEGPRSDFLVSKIGLASVLVELKGTDVEHACEQLFSSVSNGQIKSILEEKIGFLIVCSKYPRFDTFVARAKNAAAKRFNSGFHVICDQRELEIEKVVEIDGPY